MPLSATHIQALFVKKSSSNVKTIPFCKICASKAYATGRVGIPICKILKRRQCYCYKGENASCLAFENYTGICDFLVEDSQYFVPRTKCRIYSARWNVFAIVVCPLIVFYRDVHLLPITKNGFCSSKNEKFLYDYSFYIAIWNGRRNYQNNFFFSLTSYFVSFWDMSLFKLWRFKHCMKSFLLSAQTHSRKILSNL